MSSLYLHVPFCRRKCPYCDFFSVADRPDLPATYPDLLSRHLFGAHRAAELIVGQVGGAVCGYAIFFRNFSTFRGQPGLYLEDLYVTPAGRGRGLGKALILEVARIAESRGCARFEWVCLDWNRKALDFYATLGAQAQPEWVWHRVEGKGIGKLARAPRP